MGGERPDHGSGVGSGMGPGEGSQSFAREAAGRGRPRGDESRQPPAQFGSFQDLQIANPVLHQVSGIAERKSFTPAVDGASNRIPQQGVEVRIHSPASGPYGGLKRGEQFVDAGKEFQIRLFLRSAIRLRVRDFFPAAIDHHISTEQKRALVEGGALEVISVAFRPAGFPALHSLFHRCAGPPQSVKAIIRDQFPVIDEEGRVIGGSDAGQLAPDAQIDGGFEGDPSVCARSNDQPEKVVPDSLRFKKIWCLATGVWPFGNQQSEQAGPLQPKAMI